MSDRIPPDSPKCICEWPEDCGGLGFLLCEGCGGDQCVCRCGGEMSCGGCEECDWGEYGDYGDDDDRVCRVCGCTDLDCRGCVERTGTPCHWVLSDLCSACVRAPQVSASGTESAGQNLNVQPK